MKYIVVLYKDNEKTGEDFKKESFQEIEARLEGSLGDWNKAMVYHNEEPFINLGHYILYNNRITYIEAE